MRTRYALAGVALGVFVVLTGCSGAPASASKDTIPPLTKPPVEAGAPAVGAVATEAAVAAEKSPPGDIPDNQAFVSLKTAASFTLKVPEGWSRSDKPTSLFATDKLNTIDVRWSSATAAPTVATARSADVPALKAAGGAFELVKIESAKLPAGDAVLIRYRVNSQPNDVTGKRYRLDVERYELFHSGTRVDLILLSPVGADNVDPWRIVTRSLTW